MMRSHYADSARFDEPMQDRARRSASCGSQEPRRARLPIEPGNARLRPCAGFPKPAGKALDLDHYFDREYHRWDSTARTTIPTPSTSDNRNRRNCILASTPSARPQKYREAMTRAAAMVRIASVVSQSGSTGDACPDENFSRRVRASADIEPPAFTGPPPRVAGSCHKRRGPAVLAPPDC